MRRKTAYWAISLIVALINTSVEAADRYDLILTDASYSNPEQSELNYASFVGDRQTGAIYSCAGKVYLQQKTGAVIRHTESCTDAYVPPPGLPAGEYTFSSISASNAPKMNPDWGFWRIDQARHLQAFCMRYGPKPVWTCFETPLPQR
jgi:hypothetical protein